MVYFCAVLHIFIYRQVPFPVAAAINGLTRGKCKRRCRVAQSLGDDREEEALDAFQGRMEAQCNEIRKYRQQLLENEGRQLSYDEAALEWVERYAELFARKHDADPGEPLAGT